MNYLQTYTVGSILATAWRIYLREWSTLLIIYIIPLVVIHAFNSWVKTTDMGALGLVLGTTSLFLASMFVSFPLTVAISEICLNIRPKVGRSYRRAFAEPGKLIRSYLLAFIIILLGFLALYIPGLVFSVWYTFIGPVVVLEALAGRAALKRSRELGRGHYLRNFGIIFLANILTLLLAIVLGGILGFLLALAFAVDLGVAEFLGGLVGLLVAPPAVIVLVLLYYDMRVRKEGYAAAQLADDLRF
jgi:hypothetical protein